MENRGDIMGLLNFLHIFKNKPYTNIEERFVEPKYTIDPHFHRPKYDYEGYFKKQELKFILECAMKTGSIDKVDPALVGLYYTHPRNLHRLLEWVIYRRDNLTMQELKLLMSWNVLFYQWLYDISPWQAKKEAMKCMHHQPPVDCGSLSIIIPKGVSVNEVNAHSTKRQLTTNRQKSAKKKRKHKNKGKRKHR